MKTEDGQRFWNSLQFAALSRYFLKKEAQDSALQTEVLVVEFTSPRHLVRQGLLVKLLRALLEQNNLSFPELSRSLGMADLRERAAAALAARRAPAAAGGSRRAA